MTQRDFLKAVGRNIDQIRKEKGLSFQEMADRCNLEKSSLVRLAGQGTNITMATLYKIAKGLQVPVREIFEF
ncbi:helix-turn-helix transcriptional regulator [Fulvivirgaceae bacterium BMA12]|uniref:Helix-turn-helix transcriptional regulator n=1 Tax=Agaribacillus aureus TaxID=3051825 RepID=A0ABT8L687_9BACT|nr:helix-turn-helix transcriptional regulator [Fulvivirgaceae bacterium BMA12]